MHAMHPFFRVPYGLVMRLIVAPLELNIKIPFVITSNTLAKPTVNTPKVPNPLLLPIYHTVFSHGTDWATSYFSTFDWDIEEWFHKVIPLLGVFLVSSSRAPQELLRRLRWALDCYFLVNWIMYNTQNIKICVVLKFTWNNWEHSWNFFWSNAEFHKNQVTWIFEAPNYPVTLCAGELL